MTFTELEIMHKAVTSMPPHEFENWLFEYCSNIGQGWREGYDEGYSDGYNDGENA